MRAFDTVADVSVSVETLHKHYEQNSAVSIPKEMDRTEPYNTSRLGYKPTQTYQVQP